MIVVKYVKYASQFNLVMYDLTLFVVTEHTDRLESRRLIVIHQYVLSMVAIH